VRSRVPRRADLQGSLGGCATAAGKPLRSLGSIYRYFTLLRVARVYSDRRSTATLLMCAIASHNGSSRNTGGHTPRGAKHPRAAKSPATPPRNANSVTGTPARGVLLVQHGGCAVSLNSESPADCVQVVAQLAA
jgi:hypothetical protein